MEDPTALQTLLNNSQTSLIPESLVTTLTIGFIVLNVLAVLFFVFYVIGMIRKWKVQSAVFDIKNDLAEIKSQLAKPTEPKFDPVVPAAQNQTIAQAETPSSNEPQPPTNNVA